MIKLTAVLLVCLLPVNHVFICQCKGFEPPWRLIQVSLKPLCIFYNYCFPLHFHQNIVY